MSFSISGFGALTEDKSWVVVRHGGGALLTPSNSSTRGWVHLAIPTGTTIPPMHGFQVLVRLATGTQAHVRTIHVYSAEKLIEVFPDLDLNGSVHVYPFDVRSNPWIVQPASIGISLDVAFDATGPDA